MEYLRVKNWERYQHYKNRYPPWIKLHAGLLEDYDFECLPDASKLLAICIWMLASRVGHNKIPNDLPWLTRKLPIKAKIDLTPLIDAGFLECLRDASTTLAPCLRDADSEERQRRDREETENISHDASKAEIDLVYQHYLTARSLTDSQYALTPKRREKIKARLKEFEPAALCAAIDAAVRSKFHQGDNPQGRVYLDLADHILRSTEKVERWLTDWRGNAKATS